MLNRLTGPVNEFSVLRQENSVRPFFLSSGFPFLTVAKTMSPDPAAGSRLRRPLIPFTAIIYRFLAPVLSAQFITAPTGRPKEIRNFPPEVPPRPGTQVRNISVKDLNTVQCYVSMASKESSK